jgi:hypothetical protein
VAQVTTAVVHLGDAHADIAHLDTYLDGLASKID